MWVPIPQSTNDPLVASFFFAGRSDSILEAYPDVISLPSIGPALTLNGQVLKWEGDEVFEESLSPINLKLLFEEEVNLTSQANLEVENSGTAAIYYSWKVACVCVCVEMCALYIYMHAFLPCSQSQNLIHWERYKLVRHSDSISIPEDVSAINSACFPPSSYVGQFLPCVAVAMACSCNSSWPEAAHTRDVQVCQCRRVLRTVAHGN